ncbi:MAG: hypothetical protein OEM22_00715 [Acidimicrobiia bacterium]|nr:hypothetical protein [Acidimicrobiia bacterium]MDH3469992.1 hypothetical protein [Acidimicrobiia bacterium]
MADGVDARFRDRFGADPELTVRAPGRVNLIGEHTDYSFLPVLPMAIQRSVVIAAGPAESYVEVASTIEEDVIRFPHGAAAPDEGWGRYLFGVLDVLGEEAAGRTARLLVDGDLPSSGGLASSSALTVGLLAALAQLWDLDLDRQELVDLAIRAERVVGVESGSMDQTVIMFAREGSAMRLDFEPPQIRHIPVPEDIAFAIGFSGQSAPKGSTVKEHYNRAVISCRAAASLLGAAMGVDAGVPPRLAGVREASDHEIDALPEVTSAGKVASTLAVEPISLTTMTAGEFPSDAAITPRRAARHVLAEARRVDLAEEALAEGDGAELGRLFDASHSSLQEFGASTHGLDVVVDAARLGGALGSRLTGAGFGGWAVALCSPDLVANVVEAMSVAGGGPAFPVDASAGLS